MYHELSKKEIDRFIRKHFNQYDEDVWKIKTISCISYNDVYEYLIDKKHTLRIFN